MGKGKEEEGWMDDGWMDRYETPPNEPRTGPRKVGFQINKKTFFDPGSAALVWQGKSNPFRTEPPRASHVGKREPLPPPLGNDFSIPR